MSADVFIFWFLAFVTVVSGLVVITVSNPIYSALSLVMAMVGLAGVFVTLGAYFLAGVQLIVYAGAVMVLFVMVLMLFDLKEEKEAFSRGQITGAIKLGSVGVFAGLIVGTLVVANGLFAEADLVEASKLPADPSKAVGMLLYGRHAFGFEVLGVLLLVIAIGAVALARSRGGTHGK